MGKKLSSKQLEVLRKGRKKLMEMRRKKKKG